MKNVQAKDFPWTMIAIAIAACLGLTMAAYAIGVRPLIESQAREAVQRDALRESRSKAAGVAAEVADIQRHMAADKEALARTPVRLQPASLVNQRLAAITQLALDCGLSLDEIRPGSGVDAAHFQTVPIRIVGGGRYPACAAFLSGLRKTFGDMGVRQFIVTNVNAATPTNAPVAGFQAELVWFTELPRK